MKFTTIFSIGYLCKREPHHLFKIYIEWIKNVFEVTDEDDTQDEIDFSCLNLVDEF